MEQEKRILELELNVAKLIVATKELTEICKFLNEKLYLLSNKK